MYDVWAEYEMTPGPSGEAFLPQPDAPLPEQQELAQAEVWSEPATSLGESLDPPPSADWTMLDDPFVLSPAFQVTKSPSRRSHRLT